MVVDSSSVSHQFKYDVFLSFRGEDTRRTFVDHLYAALHKNEITCFKDDARNISSKAIEESRFAIVIFSKSYASSSWCLDELVNIMECRNRNEQFVLPVYYYDFNPSNLRKQGSVFGELFGKYDMKKVSAWTSALVEAANLSGLGLTDYRSQENQIAEIVKMVLNKLNFENVNFTYNSTPTGMVHDLRDANSKHEKLIGMERAVHQVKKMLQVETVKTTSNSAFASSSPRSTRWTYDVFMCYKGDATCKDFADQLHCALEQQQIYAFINDKGLARDESIALEYLKVIKESYIALVIFSKNYVAASCCLDELVIIMNCNEKFGKTVLPVYFDVDPSDVRNQISLFWEAVMRNKPEKAEIWRKALVKAGSLAGWYMNGTPKSHEASIINTIVDVISRRLVSFPLSVDDNLIGIEVRIKHVMPLLELESGGVHILGIWGMGGIGKTTIARAVYDQVSIYYDGSCFVENIRERSKKYGLERIQEEVLSKLAKEHNLHVRSVNEGTNLIRDHLAHHKVHMVLDDVDHISQLEALVGACNWFGDGSRIIITTRDESVLVAHNIMHNYYVKALDDIESTHFLRRHAFKKDELTKGYEDLLPLVISYASGLPLSLKVLSLLLCGKSKREWTNTLARLKVFPEKDIQDRLRISFDGLDDDEKNIFLDVACFFNGMEKDKVVRILDSCGFSGDNGIRLLEQKSFISISKGCINMHPLLQQMGRNIVREIHPDKPEKHSRLWHADEVYDVLIEKTGTKEISAIVVDDMPDQDAVDLTEGFRGMENLRLLQIRGNYKLRFLQGPTYLPNDLCWLTWENYPLQSLPTSFKANKLVSLELVHCSISELQLGDKYMGTLQFLNLSYCTKLIRTPNFTRTPNLEELKLEFCTSLKKVHESIGSLKRLTILNLSSCKELSILPQSILQLSSLSCLNLRGCSKLMLTKLMIKVSPTTVDLQYLLELDLSGYRSLSLWKSLRTIKHHRGFALHETLVKMVPELRLDETWYVNHILGSANDHGLTSESQTSQELIEYEKETPPFLPRKGV